MNSKAALNRCWLDLQFNSHFYHFHWRISPRLWVWTDLYNRNCFNLIYWQSNYPCTMQFSLTEPSFSSDFILLSNGPWFKLNDSLQVNLSTSGPQMRMHWSIPTYWDDCLHLVGLESFHVTIENENVMHIPHLPKPWNFPGQKVWLPPDTNTEEQHQWRQPITVTMQGYPESFF